MARAALHARAAIGLLLLGGHATARGAELVDPTLRQSWSGATARGLLGYTLASADVDGDGAADLLAGNPGYDGPGAVVVYAHDGAGFATEPSYLLPGARSDSEIGRQLATGDLDGDGVEDILGAGTVPGVEIFYGGVAGPSAGLALVGDGLGDFGEQLAAGDVNGDGIADALVGSPLYSGSEDYFAVLHTYLGGVEGVSTPDWSDPWSCYSEYNWCALTSPGDVDGDGFGDALVGLQGFSARAEIWFGGTDGWRDMITVEGAPSSYQLFGSVVSGVGDINGDGYADVGVADPAYYSDGDDRAGRVYLYYGASDEPAATGDILIPAAGFRGFGGELAGGDLDADGVSDVVARVFISSDATDDCGVLVFPGAPAGVLDEPQLIVESGYVYEQRFLVIDDADGDGSDELLLGLYLDGTEFQGTLHLYGGIPTSDADVDADGFSAGPDCDDTDAAIHPGAAETCDGLDEDCDGQRDEGATDATSWSTDADGDGFTVGDAIEACAAPAGTAAPTALDCDDTDASVFPGATEVPGDGIDQDCDGVSTEAGDSGDPTTEPACGCEAAGRGWQALPVALALALRRGAFRRFAQTGRQGGNGGRV